MTSASTDPNDDGYANTVCQRILQTTLQELTKFMQEDGHQPFSERFMHRGGIALSWLCASTGQFMGALVANEDNLSVVVNDSFRNVIGNATDVLAQRIGRQVEVSVAPLSTKPGDGALVGMLAAGQAALHTLRTIERCVTDQLQEHLIKTTAHGLEEALRVAGVRVIVAKPQPPKVL